jgi:hypothetical protein
VSCLRRRPRIFLSYAHEDIEQLEGLIARFRSAGIDPVWDAGIERRARLEMAIKHLIDSADGLVALGSTAYMASRWGQEEVRYARVRGKAYLPVVVESVTPEEVPVWFRGAEQPEDEETLYLPLREPRDWEVLVRKALGLGGGVRPACGVAIVAMLLVVLPSVIVPVAGAMLGRAGAEVQRLQALVEMRSREVDRCRGDGGRSCAVLADDGSSDVIYIGPGNFPIARDSFGRSAVGEQVLQQRRYVEDGREIARDTFVVHHAPNGRASSQKRREIFVDGDRGVQIEDTFDSTGRLVQKRVRSTTSQRWILYGDAGASVYPLLTPWVPFVVGYR